jgi:organic radical activating enzyme
MGDPLTSTLYKGGRTLSVMPTYACSAQCKDCGTVSSPHDRNKLPLDIMLSAIQQAKELGFANVVFTGGEATLRWADLIEAIRYANSLDMPTRLVTNAHWASNDPETDNRIIELVEAGLKEINYSTGDEHVRFVPLDYIINGILSALARSLTLAVMIELRTGNKISKASVLDHPKVVALDEADRRKIKLLESPWMPLSPRVFERYPDGAAINQDNIASAGGCDSVLQTYVIQADGRIGACCGLGMRITPELNVGTASGEHFLADAISEAEGDLLKLLLHYKGPEKLLAWAATKNPSIAWEDLYAHKCQSCMRIYKDPEVAAVVRKYHAELIAGVLQAAWIEEEFYPKVGAGVEMSAT